MEKRKLWIGNWISIRKYLKFNLFWVWHRNQEFAFLALVFRSSSVSFFQNYYYRISKFAAKLVLNLWHYFEIKHIRPISNRENVSSTHDACLLSAWHDSVLIAFSLLVLYINWMFFEWLFMIILLCGSLWMFEFENKKKTIIKFLFEYTFYRICTKSQDQFYILF